MATEGVTKKQTRKLLFKLGNIILILALAGFGGFYFKKYQDLKKNPPSTDQAAQAEVDRTVAAVGKLYSLPKDEKPSVATVKDKTKLKDQPFFDKAENGDVTLIYSNAKLAILYRPSTNKIINVSSVSIQSTKPTVKIIGDTAGRASIEQAIKTTYANDVTDGGTGDAKTTPIGITVVDLTGQNGTVVKKLADGLKGQVGNLPAGEDKPTGVDILIVVGPS